MHDRKQIAGLLNAAARLMELLDDDSFRAKSYRNAARGVEGFDGDFQEILDLRTFGKIRGVGPGIASELRALMDTGTLPALEELHARVPPGVRDLLRVPGMGVKKVQVLWAHGVDSLPALVSAAQDGRLARLPGFGAKSAASALKDARFALAATTSLNLNHADTLAARLSGQLAELLEGADITVTGALRRRMETVGEIVMVIAGAAPEAVRNALEAVADAGSVTPGLQATVSGFPVRLRAAEEDERGWVVLQTTGSEEFTAGLEQPAGAAPDEAAAFRLLERDPVPPELRESADPEVPDDLLEESDIGGVVHSHSTWSDGAHTIREMVAAARKLGYAYLGVSDHSASSFYANGLSAARVEEQATEIALIRQELEDEGSDFRLLHGMEVDILPDGTLDYPDALLERLDFTVVSVHQNFGLSQAKQTARIIKAVQHPLATILGHPSGRKLLQRPGYEVDLDAVTDACAEAGTVVEINANPRRLDLDWRIARRASARGCLFGVHPDAHSANGFGDMRYGVAMARKAGLTRAQVVSTAQTADDFLARLKTQRR